jgi:hypothetical protein
MYIVLHEQNFKLAIVEVLNTLYLSDIIKVQSAVVVTLQLFG